MFGFLFLITYLIISFCVFFQTLHLHKNQIVNLQHCEFYLPGNLEILTLANNNLTDLNEVSHLVQLCNLKEVSISGNPCVSMTGNNAYPFTIAHLYFSH